MVHVEPSSGGLFADDQNGPTSGGFGTPRAFVKQPERTATQPTGSATSRPAQVVGIHFFNPVPVLRLVELVTSLLTIVGVLLIIALFLYLARFF